MVSPLLPAERRGLVDQRADTLPLVVQADLLEISRSRLYYQARRPSAEEVALAQATSEICNSDQGSHFTSAQYRSLLLGAGVQISMDGKGWALDNIFMERLWRSVKYEEVYPNASTTPREARQGLARFLTFYSDVL